jgi:hypothetical protein
MSARTFRSKACSVALTSTTGLRSQSSFRLALTPLDCTPILPVLPCSAKASTLYVGKIIKQLSTTTGSQTYKYNGYSKWAFTPAGLTNAVADLIKDNDPCQGLLTKNGLRLTAGTGGLLPYGPDYGYFTVNVTSELQGDLACHFHDHSWNVNDGWYNDGGEAVAYAETASWSGKWALPYGLLGIVIGTSSMNVNFGHMQYANSTWAASHYDSGMPDMEDQAACEANLAASIGVATATATSQAKPAVVDGAATATVCILTLCGSSTGTAAVAFHGTFNFEFVGVKATGVGSSIPLCGLPMPLCVGATVNPTTNVPSPTDTIGMVD